MSESVATETTGRAVNPADADQALTILSRHALTVRDATAPVSVTVANGPISLRIDWNGAPTSGADASLAVPFAAGASATVSTPSHGAHLPVAASNGHHRAENGNGEGPVRTDTFDLTAETVGVFYRQPEPGAAPFVTEGEEVRPGQQVGIVEAMKLMIPVNATRAGRVVEILVDNGEAVEHGAALLRFEEIR